MVQQWCRSDILVQLGKDQAKVMVSVPMEHRDNVNGAIMISVKGPEYCGLVTQDEVWGFKPEFSSEETDEPGLFIEYTVGVYVPATETFPVEVEVRPTLLMADVMGGYADDKHSNEWVNINVY